MVQIFHGQDTKYLRHFPNHRPSRRLVRQLTRWCLSFRLTMAVVHGWKEGGAHLTGNTWTGRGRMPRWMVAATKGGKANKEDFIIS